jgi:hypothetical protein
LFKYKTAKERNIFKKNLLGNVEEILSSGFRKISNPAAPGYYVALWNSLYGLGRTLLTGNMLA